LKHSAAGVLVLVLVGGGVARAEPIEQKARTAQTAKTAHPAARARPQKVAYIAPSSPVIATPAAAPVPPAASERPKEEGSNGLLDPFRIGAFTGIGFPRPIGIEGFVKIEKIIGLGIEYSFAPDLTISGVATQLNAVMGDFRVFPFENAFFIGMGVGHQHLSAQSASAIPELGGATPGITVDAFLLNPRVGFLYTWGWGLTLGIDAGLQIPVAAQTHSTIPSGVSFSPDPTGMANTFGRSILPTVDILRLGLLL
jgi:hypothetical protein